MQEQQALARKERVRDLLFGRNAPQGGFCLSGAQLIPSSDTEQAGKRPSRGPPMYIGDQPPGAGASNDAQWTRIYGATIDSYLCLVRGTKVQDTIDDISIDGIYKDGSVNASDDNTWMRLEGNRQQISYLVSKNTISEGTSATEAFGEIDEVRGLGWRVPQIAGGWGRTIDGLPTDPEPSVDTNGRRNDDIHKLDRNTWKFGPIEMRWDYRKGVWSAYNELIEDHYDAGLGTYVFGTNDDESNGYPFLRGRLQDVFWVRQPLDYQGADGRGEGVQTASVMIHTKARLFDEEEDGSALLNTVFIIPHTESSDDDTHPKAEENTLGDEITGQDEKIDVRTEVHFFEETGKCAPIDFGPRASEVEVCCKPAASKYFTGTMLFMDEEPEFCDGGTTGGSTINGAGGSPIAFNAGGGQNYRWSPAIRIDECELMGNHMVKLVSNDVLLGRSIGSVCNNIASWSSTVSTAATAGFGSISAAISCLNTAIGTFATSINAANVASFNELEINLLSFGSELQDVLSKLVTDINFALAECGCNSRVPPIVIPQFDHLGIPNVTPPGPCAGGGGAIPAFDCSSCPTIQVQGACTTEDTYEAAVPCSTTVSATTVTTEFGDCQNHDD